MRTSLRFDPKMHERELSKEYLHVDPLDRNIYAKYSPFQSHKNLLNRKHADFLNPEKMRTNTIHLVRQIMCKALTELIKDNNCPSEFVTTSRFMIYVHGDVSKLEYSNLITDILSKIMTADIGYIEKLFHYKLESSMSSSDMVTSNLGTLEIIMHMKRD